MEIETLSEEEFDKIMSNALKLSNRRISLSKKVPKCPSCKDEQVQLVEYNVSPAQWKCRKCKHKFSFE